MAGPGLVLAQSGAVALLSALRYTWLPSLRIGLYSNLWWPQTGDNIGRYTPADFPGYGGLAPMNWWGTPTLDGDIAVITAPPVVWTRGAGLGGGWVFGYYVVDPDGVLMWAERVFGEGGIVVGYEGSIVTVTPTFAMGSRYPRI